MQLMCEVQLDVIINHDLREREVEVRGSGLDRRGSGQSSSSGAKLARSFRRHTLRWLQARQRWVILTFRWSGTSSCPQPLAGGRLSFLGLSGVYCKQRRSWLTRSWLFNGCYQNHEDGSAVSNACAETSWMMQVGGTRRDGLWAAFVFLRMLECRVQTAAEIFRGRSASTFVSRDFNVSVK